MDLYDECLSILKQEEESECPGRYCGRILLNITTCAFSDCQVNIHLLKPEISDNFDIYSI